MSKWSSPLLSVLRFVTGLLFVEHGTQKVFSFPSAVIHQGPAPEGLMAVLGQTSAILELVGGILILIGLFTRVAAFILSGEMAFAYFLVHFPKGLYPIDNHGELAALYCFVFLYLAAAGGGPFSIDRLRHRT
jgi:putative oxidoreductase